VKYKNCPIGTKAHSATGGYWIKTNRGWKWCTGDTFPTPGGDVIRIELPISKQHGWGTPIKRSTACMTICPNDVLKG